MPATRGRKVAQASTVEKENGVGRTPRRVAFAATTTPTKSAKASTTKGDAPTPRSARRSLWENKSAEKRSPTKDALVTPEKALQEGRTPRSTRRHVSYADFPTPKDDEDASPTKVLRSGLRGLNIAATPTKTRPPATTPTKARKALLIKDKTKKAATVDITDKAKKATTADSQDKAKDKDKAATADIPTVSATKPRGRPPKSGKKVKATPSASLSKLELLSRALHASVRPPSLACRDDELERIAGFVRDVLVERRSQSLYISGVPGTGKSACVLKAVEMLEEDEDCPPFRFVSINGMNLTEPSQLYTTFLTQLDPQAGKVSAAKALERLNDILLHGSAKREAIVVLADELDAVCVGRQSVVYQLFDWANQPQARLVVLAVANTLDLPERILSHRVASRLGMAREYFQPYEFAQVVQILEERLGSAAGAVDSEALELISRKVAAQSGDLRKALHIAREAAGIAIKAGDDQLASKHVQAAVRRLRETPVQHWLRGLPRPSRLLLHAWLAEYSRTGHEDVPFCNVALEAGEQAKSRDLSVPSESELRGALRSLVEAGILLALPSHSARHQPLRLAVPAEDVTFALQEAETEP